MKGNGDLDLDALLGRWPAEDLQKNGGPSWDERADAIVAAAAALKKEGSAEVIEALLAPPPLVAEAGEEKAGASQPAADAPKKPSLKELAARARTSIPPASTSTPPPGRISSIPGGGATVTPIHRAAAAKPGKEDSGVLRLADLQAEVAKKDADAAAAKAAEIAAAKAAEDAAKEPKKVAAAPVPVVASAPAANGNGKNGMWAGLAIAVLGVAAAFAIYRTRQPSTAPAKTDVVAINTQAAQSTSAPAVTAAPAATAEPAAVASTEVAPQATAAAKAGDPAQGVGGQGPAAPATAVALNEPKPATSAAPKGDGKVGTLDEEMKKAVGPNESQPAPQDDSKPASGAASGSNLPDQPSQGNAQAAVRAVLPAAKACVAGATEPSMASITFGSSGSVQSVSVSGWAATNGKAGCVKSALQGAHVQPFARPTFTVPATIRP
ncbi:MAG: hypothetical protein U0441_04115 [Polyangiaceae bacterium]